MIKYVLKRLALLIPILIGVSFIIFAIMEFTPGDPAIRILGNDAGEEALIQLRQKMGLDKSFIERYVSYVFKVLTQFDFGVSWRTGKPVFVDIGPRIPVSLLVAFLGMIAATLFGVPLGVFSAVKQNSAGDNIMRVVSTMLVATPSFWLAMLLILFFSLRLGVLPSSGITSWQSYILPVITCAGPKGCMILRITRSTMLESIREDYVRTARAKGVPNRIVTYSHALKNALLPVITTIGTSFGSILGGAIVAESVFSLPGLGSLIILSIKSKDTPTLIACVLLLAFFFAVIMLIVDLIYAFVDPRIKAKYAKQ